MEVKYYREGARNYLVICSHRADADTYQQKMMERQTFQYFFPCKMRSINGSYYYYYDITSKVSMLNLHQGKKWDLEKIGNFFRDCQAAFSELEQYLLDEDMLILQPEYIYYDYGTKNYYFLFFPEYENGPERTRPYIMLFDYWLEYLNNEDMNTVDVVYSLYEEAEHGVLSIERIMKVVGDIETGEKEINTEHPETSVSMDAAFSASMDSGYFPEEQVLFERSMIDEIPEKQFKEKDFLEKKHSNRALTFYIVFLVMILLGEAGAGAVAYFMKCSDTELLVLLAVAIVMGCLLVVDIVLLWKDIASSKQRKIPDESLLETEKKRFIQMEQQFSPQIAMNSFLSARTDGSKMIESPVGSAAAKNGETVFFADESNCERKLYSMDRRNKIHISLDKLPCTIGKMVGAVDYCLEDPSVSRLHARIESDGRNLFLIDLNSTNGSYVNGLLLGPNECMKIEPGDEIRFGKLKYSYR